MPSPKPDSRKRTKAAYSSSLSSQGPSTNLTASSLKDKSGSSTSNNYGEATHTPLTPYAIEQHAAHQAHQYHSPVFTQAEYHSAGTYTHMPAYTNTDVTQPWTDTSPIENSQALSTYSYQRYSGYSPLGPQHNDPYTSYTSLPASTCSPQRSTTTGSISGSRHPSSSQEAEYYIPEPSFSYAPANVEYDIADIGSQFDGQGYGEFEQTLDTDA